MPADPFTELRISPHGSGIVVVSPAPISGGHLQMVSPEYAHPMRDELRMPLDTHLIIFSITDLPNWQGYTCELVGVQEQFKFVRGYAEQANPPEAPRFTFCVAGVAGHDIPLTLIAWRRQVHCQGTPVFLEVLWRPETGETIELKGLEWSTTQESLKRVHRGLRLLKAIEVHGGRPHDTRYYSQDQFHARYPGAVADAKKRRGVHIKDEDIARAFPVSVSTFYRYLRKYGRPSLS